MNAQVVAVGKFFQAGSSAGSGGNCFAYLWGYRIKLLLLDVTRDRRAVI